MRITRVVLRSEEHEELPGLFIIADYYCRLPEESFCYLVIKEAAGRHQRHCDITVVACVVKDVEKNVVIWSTSGSVHRVSRVL